MCAISLWGSYTLLNKTVEDIEGTVMVHLVRDNSSVEIAPGIRIELIDVETLKGKKGWEFNSKINDIEHILREVFIRSKADENKLKGMNAASWEQYISSLAETKDIELNLTAEKVKDIPFAKYRVFVDGVPDENFSSKYFFKGEVFCIPFSFNTCENVKVSIENIYNTKHYSSGESEASNVKISYM